MKSPLSCPNCGADLSVPGSAILWQQMPEMQPGHLAPGDGGVDFVVDAITSDGAVFWVQCAECGDPVDDHPDFEVRDIYIDPYAEEAEEQEEQNPNT